MKRIVLKTKKKRKKIQIDVHTLFKVVPQLPFKHSSPPLTLCKKKRKTTTGPASAQSTIIHRVLRDSRKPAALWAGMDKVKAA